MSGFDTQSSAKQLVSVVVCAYNSRAVHLNPTLEKIFDQTLRASHYEVVLIDNRSNPPLQQRHDLRLPSQVRVVVEVTPGLTAARLRGAAETSGDPIVFVDDDNVLKQDYLETAARLCVEHPYLGVFSANVQGRFDTPPEPWMKPFLPFLAIHQVEKPKWANHAAGGTLPIGAGMVVRRSVMEQYRHRLQASDAFNGLDRVGSSLLAGGDTDIGMAAIEIGLGCAYMPSLEVTHLIPRDRLDPRYLYRIVRDVTASHTLLARLHGSSSLPLRSALRFQLTSWIGALMPRRSTRQFNIARADGMLLGHRLYRQHRRRKSTATLLPKP